MVTPAEPAMGWREGGAGVGVWSPVRAPAVWQGGSLPLLAGPGPGAMLGPGAAGYGRASPQRVHTGAQPWLSQAGQQLEQQQQRLPGPLPAGPWPASSQPQPAAVTAGLLPYSAPGPPIHPPGGPGAQPGVPQDALGRPPLSTIPPNNPALLPAMPPLQQPTQAPSMSASSASAATAAAAATGAAAAAAEALLLSAEEPADEEDASFERVHLLLNSLQLPGTDRPSSAAAAPVLRLHHYSTVPGPGPAAGPAAVAARAAAAVLAAAAQAAAAAAGGVGSPGWVQPGQPGSGGGGWESSPTAAPPSPTPSAPGAPCGSWNFDRALAARGDGPGWEGPGAGPRGPAAGTSVYSIALGSAGRAWLQAVQRAAVAGAADHAGEAGVGEGDGDGGGGGCGRLGVEELVQQLREAQRERRLAEAAVLAARLGLPRRRLARLEAAVAASGVPPAATLSLLDRLEPRLLAKVVLAVLKEAAAEAAALEELLASRTAVGGPLVAAAWRVWRRAARHRAALRRRVSAAAERSCFSAWRALAARYVTLRSVLRSCRAARLRRLLHRWRAVAAEQAAAARRRAAAAEHRRRALLTAALAHWRYLHVARNLARVWEAALARRHELALLGRVLRVWCFFAKRCRQLIRQLSVQKTAAATGSAPVVVDEGGLAQPLRLAALPGLQQRLLGAARQLMAGMADELLHLRSFLRFGLLVGPCGPLGQGAEGLDGVPVSGMAAAASSRGQGRGRGGARAMPVRLSAAIEGAERAAVWSSECPRGEAPGAAAGEGEAAPVSPRLLISGQWAHKRQVMLLAAQLAQVQRMAAEVDRQLQEAERDAADAKAKLQAAADAVQRRVTGGREAAAEAAAEQQLLTAELEELEREAQAVAGYLERCRAAADAAAEKEAAAAAQLAEAEAKLQQAAAVAAAATARSQAAARAAAEAQAAAQAALAQQQAHQRQGVDDALNPGPAPSTSASAPGAAAPRPASPQLLASRGAERRGRERLLSAQRRLAEALALKAALSAHWREEQAAAAAAPRYASQRHALRVGQAQSQVVEAAKVVSLAEMEVQDLLSAVEVLRSATQQREAAAEQVVAAQAAAAAVQAAAVEQAGLAASAAGEQAAAAAREAAEAARAERAARNEVTVLQARVYSLTRAREEAAGGVMPAGAADATLLGPLRERQRVLAEALAAVRARAAEAQREVAEAVAAAEATLPQQVEAAEVAARAALLRLQPARAKLAASGQQLRGRLAAYPSELVRLVSAVVERRGVEACQDEHGDWRISNLPPDWERQMRPGLLAAAATADDDLYDSSNSSSSSGSGGDDGGQGGPEEAGLGSAASPGGAPAHSTSPAVTRRGRRSPGRAGAAGGVTGAGGGSGSTGPQRGGPRRASSGPVAVSSAPSSPGAWAPTGVADLSAAALARVARSALASAATRTPEARTDQSPLRSARRGGGLAALAPEAGSSAERSVGARGGREGKGRAGSKRHASPLRGSSGLSAYGIRIQVRGHSPGEASPGPGPSSGPGLGLGLYRSPGRAGYTAARYPTAQSPSGRWQGAAITTAAAFSEGDAGVIALATRSPPVHRERKRVARALGFAGGGRADGEAFGGMGMGGGVTVVPVGEIADLAQPVVDRPWSVPVPRSRGGPRSGLRAASVSPARSPLRIFERVLGRPLSPGPGGGSSSSSSSGHGGGEDEEGGSDGGGGGGSSPGSAGGGDGGDARNGNRSSRAGGGARGGCASEGLQQSHPGAQRSAVPHTTTDAPAAASSDMPPRGELQDGQHASVHGAAYAAMASAPVSVTAALARSSSGLGPEPGSALGSFGFGSGSGSRSGSHASATAAALASPGQDRRSRTGSGSGGASAGPLSKSTSAGSSRDDGSRNARLVDRLASLSVSPGASLQLPSDRGEEASEGEGPEGFEQGARRGHASGSEGHQRSSDASGSGRGSGGASRSRSGDGGASGAATTIGETVDDGLEGLPSQAQMSYGQPDLDASDDQDELSYAPYTSVYGRASGGGDGDDAADPDAYAGVADYEAGGYHFEHLNCDAPTAGGGGGGVQGRRGGRRAPPRRPAAPLVARSVHDAAALFFLRKLCRRTLQGLREYNASLGALAARVGAVGRTGRLRWALAALVAAVREPVARADAFAAANRAFRAYAAWRVWVHGRQQEGVLLALVAARHRERLLRRCWASWGHWMLVQEAKQSARLLAHYQHLRWLLRRWRSGAEALAAAAQRRAVADHLYGRSLQRRCLGHWRRVVRARRLLGRVLATAEALWEIRCDTVKTLGAEFLSLRAAWDALAAYTARRAAKRTERINAVAAEAHRSSLLRVRALAAWRAAVELAWQERHTALCAARLLQHWRRLAHEAREQPRSRCSLRRRLRQCGFAGGEADVRRAYLLRCGVAALTSSFRQPRRHYERALLRRALWGLRVLPAQLEARAQAHLERSLLGRWRAAVLAAWRQAAAQRAALRRASEVAEAWRVRRWQHLSLAALRDFAEARRGRARLLATALLHHERRLMAAALRRLASAAAEAWAAAAGHHSARLLRRCVEGWRGLVAEPMARRAALLATLAEVDRCGLVRPEQRHAHGEAYVRAQEQGQELGAEGKGKPREEGQEEEGARVVLLPEQEQLWRHRRLGEAWAEPAPPPPTHQQPPAPAPTLGAAVTGVVAPASPPGPGPARRRRAQVAATRAPAVAAIPQPAHKPPARALTLAKKAGPAAKGVHQQPTAARALRPRQPQSPPPAQLVRARAPLQPSAGHLQPSTGQTPATDLPTPPSWATPPAQFFCYPAAGAEPAGSVVGAAGGRLVTGRGGGGVAEVLVLNAGGGAGDPGGAVGGRELAEAGGSEGAASSSSTPLLDPLELLRGFGSPPSSTGGGSGTPVWPQGGGSGGSGRAAGGGAGGGGGGLGPLAAMDRATRELCVRYAQRQLADEWRRRQLLRGALRALGAAAERGRPGVRRKP
ncbi:hypothetical protein HYH03_016724 [Edaphochlamys debaryana]|uniref:Uncharacterized protein n=1 Tax=Edaphochlamys debaryana TaxID=47281 RepID=A0A836BPV7_9CHLO|nr:hypothetical protein HYH03_016724 [Edaphochlamys debaryana]|eukprot:KAG2484495.1 hypothetical protein HYH03_016724 [Edaphochlamys debaryana]